MKTCVKADYITLIGLAVLHVSHDLTHVICKKHTSRLVKNMLQCFNTCAILHALRHM